MRFPAPRGGLRGRRVRSDGSVGSVGSVRSDAATPLRRCALLPAPSQLVRGWSRSRRWQHVRSAQDQNAPAGLAKSPARIPRWRVLMLRGFLAPTGAMVNSRGLPAPGPRAHSGPRGWEPLAIFRAPLGQSTNSATSKLARQASILTASTPRSEKQPQPGKTLVKQLFCRYHNHQFHSSSGVDASLPARPDSVHPPGTRTMPHRPMLPAYTLALATMILTVAAPAAPTAKTDPAATPLPRASRGTSGQSSPHTVSSAMPPPRQKPTST